MSILGTRVVRTEDPGFLTKGAIYTEDVADDRLTGALHVTFVRSPIAHAKILSIDTSAAKAMDGVVDVVTAADLTDVPEQGPMFPMFAKEMSHPLLADGVVRYVGQAVAAVITTDKYLGEDAGELVDIDYDPLPVVVDPREAAKDEILLYPELGTNTSFQVPNEPSDTFFDGCEVVITREIVNQRVAVAPLEVRSAAAVHGDGRYTVWLPNQGAQGSKGALVGALGEDAANVRVITPDVGGAFGAKFGADTEVVVVAWLAKRLGKPVRWVESRSENMLAMTHGRGQVQTVSLGGSRDGKIDAYRLEVLQECGAYARIGNLLPSLTVMMAPGVYQFDRIEASARSVVSNTTPIGAYRGAGRPEATAAIERGIDIFAAEIGMDPAEVRRRNLIPKFTEPYKTPMGATYDTGDFEAALDKALDAAGYHDLRAEQAKRREQGDPVQLGIGLCTYVEITGAGMEAGAPNENATVEVHPDGTATILTGTSPHGQGHQTVWAMLASEELGIPMENFTVKWGDTDLVPIGGGTGGSRSLQQGGEAVRQASKELIEIAKTRAASVLEVDAADLVIDKGRAGLSVAGVPDTGITFADLAGTETLLVNSTFTAPGPTFPFGAHVAVVEVDTETGGTRLTRLVAVDDAGTVLNPLLADGQRHGGLAQGAAQALLEEICYDEDGNPITSTFADYGIVSITEVPSFELVQMETPTTYNSLGAKGIGEAGTIGATPAVQNAVIDAVAHLGVRHIDMPTTPIRVWTAINASTEAAS